jgi:hypothetical protein
LDNGIFQLSIFKANLIQFNNQNRCNLENTNVKKAIQLWMSGSWYDYISIDLKLETYQVLRLINSFISFNIQTVISAVVRLKELTTIEYSMPIQIANWSSYLQHGIDSQLKLDLIEMGLIDRVATLELSRFLLSQNYIYSDYRTLKTFLVENKAIIIENIVQNLPMISFEKLRLFFDRLNIISLY